MKEGQNFDKRKEVKVVNLKKKDWQTLSRGAMFSALLAVLFGVWGMMVADIWLASTQWLLIAGVLAIFGLYAKMEQ